MEASGCVLRAACAAALLMCAGPALAQVQELRARHAQLRAAIAAGLAGEPLHLASQQDGDALGGEVVAELPHPFEQVRGALAQPAAWCEVLILPFNTKQCRVSQGPAGPRLLLRIGRKADQPLQQAWPLVMDWQAAADGPEGWQVELSADQGPLGTRDVRILVAAIPLDAGRSVLQLRYGYRVGVAGRLAMRSYLATAGADKVGFSLEGRDARGQPQPIAGVRGAVERTTMRYYLAVGAYLDALTAPPPQQVQRRLERWFAATERWPRQLHEMDRGSYLALKQGEIARQHQPGPE